MGQKRGPLPPVLLLMALLAQWAADVLLPVVQLVPTQWRILGGVPVVLGVGVMVVADRQFKAASTAINPFHSPSSLVTSGAFRFSRNPMYLAMLLILTGAAIAWGSLTPFALPPVMAGVLTARFIRVEEATMVEVFGAEYEEYKSRVRRWL